MDWLKEAIKNYDKLSESEQAHVDAAIDSMDDRRLLMSIEKLNELADKKWDLEAAVRKVNDETKVIKYDNIPSEIYLKVTNIAEEVGMDVSDSSELEWKIKEVREAVNALESAIYNFVEPFEDELRTVECDYDELEMDMEDQDFGLASVS